jgi:hypothetical protein
LKVSTTRKPQRGRKWRKPTKKELEQIRDQKRLTTEAHLGMPIADWRLKKRQQWRVVLNALRLFEFGAAYAPVGNDLYEMRKAADRIMESMEQDWVCW